MENRPLVTVITPCYNGEKFIDGYFEAILAQTYDNIELIFVNDGSTDKTEEIAKSYTDKLIEKGIKYTYLYQENGGQAKAMNTGLRKMTGKYLAWPDSDDTLSADSIEKRVDFLENNYEYAMVRTNGDYFDFDTKEYIERISNDENRFDSDIFLDMILEKTYCCCGCYMLRIDNLRQIYPDLQIPESSAGQNWQIMIPMAGRFPCGYIDEDLYHIAVRRGSHSRAEKTAEQFAKRLLELKKVLLDGIKLSGRTDRDYEYIVEIKYRKVLFMVYAKYGEKKIAEKYYKFLKSEKQVDSEIYYIYVSNGHPVQYFIFRVVNKIRRIFNRGEN